MKLRLHTNISTEKKTDRILKKKKKIVIAMKGNISALAIALLMLCQVAFSIAQFVQVAYLPVNSRVTATSVKPLLGNSVAFLINNWIYVADETINGTFKVGGDMSNLVIGPTPRTVHFKSGPSWRMYDLNTNTTTTIIEGNSYGYYTPIVANNNSVWAYMQGWKYSNAYERYTPGVGVVEDESRRPIGTYSGMHILVEDTVVNGETMLPPGWNYRNEPGTLYYSKTLRTVFYSYDDLSGSWTGTVEMEYNQQGQSDSR